MGRKINKIALIVAVIHWIIGFYTDRLFFDLSVLENDLYSKVIFIISKVLYFAVLICIWQVLFSTVKKIRYKDEKVINHLKLSLVYFFIMMVFLILTWPGVWRANEFVIINHVVKFHINLWQNYLTSIFYILCLMFMPFLPGIIIIQNIFISLIVGYIISKIYYGTGKSKLSFFMYIPFLMLPIIDQNLYPIRNTLYGYLELFFVFKIMFLKYEKVKLDKKTVFVFASLIAILSTWRSEGIYYFILGTIVVFIAFNNSFDKRCKSVFLIMTVVFTIILYLPQKIFIKDVFGDKYEISSMVSPLYDVVKSEIEKYQGENDIYEIIDSNEDLKNINKVLDLKILLKKQNGLKAYWGKPALIQKGYTPDEYSAFKKSYVNLIKNNLDSFINEREKVFLETNAFGKWNIFVGNSANLYSKRYNTFSKYIIFRKSMYTDPINKDIRKKTILFLECASKKFKPNSYFKYVYNLIPAFLGLTIMMITSLFLKKYTLSMLSLLVLIRIPLVFITAPRALFMYYFSPYLISIVIICLFVLEFLCNQFKVKRKNEANNEADIEVEV